MSTQHKSYESFFDKKNVAIFILFLMSQGQLKTNQGHLEFDFFAIFLSKPFLSVHWSQSWIIFSNFLFIFVGYSKSLFYMRKIMIFWCNLWNHSYKLYTPKRQVKAKENKMSNKTFSSEIQQQTYLKTKLYINFSSVRSLTCSLCLFMWNEFFFAVMSLTVSAMHKLLWKMLSTLTHRTFALYPFNISSTDSFKILFFSVVLLYFQRNNRCISHSFITKETNKPQSDT